jgi:hypothetical protein
MTNVEFTRGRGLLWVMVAVAAVLAMTGRTGAQSACPAFTDPEDCIDDFNCYRAAVTEDTPRFQRISGVLLQDQFESATVTVMKPSHLCTPTNKDGEGTLDPATHLVIYSIRRQSPVHVRRSAIRVTNSLEEVRVDTIRPDLLMVPTSKSLVLPSPPPPNETLHTVDHYKCYRVKVTSGTPQAALDRKITVQDQFTAQKIFTLKRPRHLCVPVSKNGEGIKNEDAHLLCYRGRRARGEMDFIARRGLFINNQFGPLRLDAVRENEFCIPTLKSLSPSGAFLDEADE